MKLLFWAGLVVLILGIVSLFVPLPHNETEGIKAGNVSLGVQVHRQEKVSPAISIVLIGGGIGMMLIGRKG